MNKINFRDLLCQPSNSFKLATTITLDKSDYFHCETTVSEMESKTSREIPQLELLNIS